MRKIFSILVLFLFLGGCSVMNYDNLPPSDFPKMEVKVVKLNFAETQTACGSNPVIGIVLTIYACASPDYASNVCTIYTATDDEGVMIHEYDHCKGYDHIGQSYMRDTWNEYKNQTK